MLVIGTLKDFSEGEVVKLPAETGELPTVLIVDSHQVYRMGLRHLLEGSLTVVGEANEGGEAVDKAITLNPDVVTMEIYLPGMGGLEATRRIKASVPDMGILIISRSDEDRCIFEAIQAGVSGYVTKDEDPDTIREAVLMVSQGKAYLPNTIARRVLEGIAGSSYARASVNPAPLSSREVTVLRMIASGKRNKEIASELEISERTVGNHISSIYNKLGIYDRAQAVVYAIKKGIVRV